MSEEAGLHPRSALILRLVHSACQANALPTWLLGSPHRETEVDSSLKPLKELNLATISCQR